MSKQTTKQTLGFQAEVKQLLHLVTHALYSNKEIFLRELISNSSDALDRLRFEALADNKLFEDNSDLKIWVNFDEKAGTLTIRDNGIGMSHDEVIANLGTIAKSGTREFLGTLTGDKSKDAHLIGQFGVGFYASFIVSDKVVVETRRAGLAADQGVIWESDGTGEYTIGACNQVERGTTITLHLKSEEKEFLDGYRLRNIISKYSDHILFPILMPKEEHDEKGKKKEVETPTWETVNRATALWTLAKKDIKDEEYQELYKHLSHDFDESLLWSHNHVEGKLDYITLLYLPKHAPFDLWQREHRHGLKLYVQRVFIMDDADQLLPNYLRFVRGLVDSKDLPLNVSRELLQSNKIIESIKSGIIKRVLDMLEKLQTDDKEKYASFWQAFGQVIKEGPAEDFANQEKIAKLLMFASTHNSDDAQSVTLDDYISRLPEGQDKIYYVTAENPKAARSNPHLEIFHKKGIEVLLLSDRIDEWLTSHLQEYKGKKLQSVAKGDLDLSKVKSIKEENKTEEPKVDAKEFEGIIKQIKDLLKDKVKDVRTTERLTDSPACLVTEENEMSLHLQRMMLASGQKMPPAQPIFELNPHHALIQKLKGETDDQRFSEWVNILFDQALLAEGGQLENPGDFVRRLNRLLLERG